MIAGPDDGARADFEHRIAEARLSHRVHLVGSLHGREKWTAFRDATCFCLPSRQEGFSVAILESLASRTPVVVSDACHFPEVATVGAGQVVELDATAVASALKRVSAMQLAAGAWGTPAAMLLKSVSRGDEPPRSQSRTIKPPPRDNDEQAVHQWLRLVYIELKLLYKRRIEMSLVTVEGHTILPRALIADAIVLDVGANLGNFSLLMADASGCVCHAIEANPAVFNRIRAHPRIQTHQLAIAGKAATWCYESTKTTNAHR